VRRAVAACERAQRLKRGLREQARALGGGQRHEAEILARDGRDAVERREALVQIAERGRHERLERPVSRQRDLDAEGLRLGHHVGLQLRRVGGKQRAVFGQLRDRVEIEPPAIERADPERRAPIVQDLADEGPELARRRDVAVDRPLHELRIRRLVPKDGRGAAQRLAHGDLKSRRRGPSGRATCAGRTDGARRARRPAATERARESIRGGSRRAPSGAGLAAFGVIRRQRPRPAGRRDEHEPERPSMRQSVAPLLVGHPGSRSGRLRTTVCHPAPEPADARRDLRPSRDSLASALIAC
jgi:hypothetical protein